MTAAAIGKIVAAESSFVVVTIGAALRVFRRKVHRRQRRADLISARRSGFDMVTSRAVEPVFGVTERRLLECLRPIRNFRGFSRLVTHAARINLSLAAFRFGRMTLKTGVVRVKSRRNRQRNAAARGLVTGRAVSLAQMFRVVETDVKAFQSGKWFHVSRFRARVTNRADDAFIIGKLRRVTTGAGHMSGALRRRRIVLALVAERARKTRVLRV